MAVLTDILALAKANSLLIATAESCTGGMISVAITDVAGSSAVFDRGFVTYSNAAKMAMLGVSGETLRDHGAVSEQVALEMVLGAQARSHAQLCVAVTGIAGPGGSDHKPEGRVCFGFSLCDYSFTETIEFGAIGRDNVRKRTTDHALAGLAGLLRRL